MRKFFTAYSVTILIFLSGFIFGLGCNRAFTKEAVIVAYDYGYKQGGESVILAALE